MTNPAERRSFVDYLDSKRTVDDRALNQHVLSSLRAELENLGKEDDLKILEVGAGIGTMITRLIDWRVITSGEYTAVDIDQELAKEGRRRLGRYALKKSLLPDCGLAREIMLQSEDLRISVDYQTADVLRYCQLEEVRGSFDLLVGHAFLDLHDLKTALPILLQSLRPNGLFYFSLNFDGITHFEPTLDAELDALIEELYHATMDDRIVAGKPSGDHHSGRHLLGALLDHGAELMAAGASDWLVHPVKGTYPAQEARFLHHILDMVEFSLQGSSVLDPNAFDHWLVQRRAQIERGDLIYLAHQIDVFGRWGH